VSDAALRAYYNERAPVYDHAYSGTAPAWVDAMVADLRAALADLARVTVVAADAYRLDELAPGAVVFLGDNQLTPAWETRLFHHDGDTYEARELPDGSTHEILENYFTADDLRAMVAPYGTDVRLTMGDWWWWLTYQVR